MALFKQANIELKTIDGFTAKELRPRSPSFKGVSYFGITIVQMTSNGRLYVCWRHDESRKTAYKWRSVETTSPREFVGKIVRHHMVRRQPLCRASLVLGHLRKAALVAREHGWDAPRLHIEMAAELEAEELWAEYSRNRWNQLSTTSAFVHYLAVDASEEGWGGVVIREGGAPMILRGVWAKGMSDMHIFVLEVFALCHVVQLLIAQGLEGTFLIAEDNSAARHAINTMYSSNDVANKKIPALHHLLQQHSSCRTSSP